MATARNAGLGIFSFLQVTFALMCLTAHPSGQCHIEVSQPSVMTVQSRMQSTTLSCDVNMVRCDNKMRLFLVIHWFVFRRNSHQRLSSSSKYSFEGHSLRIISISANDSGVYYCGAKLEEREQRETQRIGNGTVLVVRETSEVNKTVLMWTLFVLVTLYSLIITILLIHKVRKRAALYRKDETVKKNSTRRAHFHAVVQEMYNRRNFRSYAATATENRPAKKKLKHSQPISPDEDLYQNA